MSRIRPILATTLAAVLVVALAAGVGPAHAAQRAGTPDRAFGDDGIVAADYGLGPSQGSAEQVLPTPDGGYLVRTGAWSIARFGPDGRLDKSFGSDGYLVGPTWLIGMGLDSRGRILLASSPESPTATVTLERFLPSGSPDRTFGKGGSLSAPVPRGPIGRLQTMLVEPDGKVLLVGYGEGAKANTMGAERLLPDGRVDRSYGDAGAAVLRVPGELRGFDPVAALDGEDLVMATYAGTPSLLVARFDAAGQLDSSFGDGGVVGATLDGGPVAVAAGADGRITVAGPERVARLMPNGSLDPSFGSAGMAKLPAGFDGVADSLVLGPDGSVAVGGSRTGNGYHGFLVARLNPDGSVDTGFGEGGSVGIGFGAPGWAQVLAHGLVAAPGGGVLVYGEAPAPAVPKVTGGAAVMYGPSGRPVSGFADDGVLRFRPMATSTDEGTGLLADRAGVTVTGGAAGQVLLARFGRGGAPDRGYRGGRTTLSVVGPPFGETGSALVADPVGSALLGTSSPSGGALLRLGKGSVRVPKFGKGGAVRLPGVDRVLDAVVTRGDAIYAIGLRLRDCRAVLARIRPDGSQDRSFGGREGLLPLGQGGGPCRYRNLRLAARPDGSVIASGSVDETVLAEYDPRHGLRRLLSGGELRAVVPKIPSASAIDPHGRARSSPGAATNT